MLSMFSALIVTTLIAGPPAFSNEAQRRPHTADTAVAMTVAAVMDSEVIPEVPMSHYLVSHPDNHDYIQTYGVSTCVAMTLYDPVSRTGILAHVAADNDFAAFMRRIANELRSNGIPANRVQAHLIGGWKGWSESIVHALFTGLRRLGVKKVKHDDVLTDPGIDLQADDGLAPFDLQITAGTGKPVRAVMLRLRDGAVFDYVEKIRYSAGDENEKISPIPLDGASPE